MSGYSTDRARASTLAAPRPLPAAGCSLLAVPDPDHSKFAVIISGVSGEETYAKQFAQWTAELRRALIERLSFAAENVKVLTEKPARGEQRSTAEAVRQIFDNLRAVARPESSVFIFFIGHGTFDGTQAKFNLVGPDLPAQAYNTMLKSLPARRIVVINMASASGEWVKALAAPGRIIITATRSGQEVNAPRFAEYFIAALTNPEADADHNKRISALEAFNYATRLVAEWYEGQGRLASEHALLEDNGDGIGHQTATEGDGLLARATYFDSLPQPQTVSAGADAETSRLVAERTRLENEVEQLKSRKEQMRAEEYETELEKLLISLARVSQTIRRRSSGQ